MKFLSALAPPRHQVGFLENREMLRHCLPGHVQPGAKVAQGLAVSVAQAIEKLAPAWVRQCLENRVIAHLATGNLLVPYLK
jgi:hypothetical protein